MFRLPFGHLSCPRSVANLRWSSQVISYQLIRLAVVAQSPPVWEELVRAPQAFRSSEASPGKAVLWFFDRLVFGGIPR
jgi:hypothetical protein